MITQRYLKSILDYNPTTGDFYWQKDYSKAGNTNKNGYITICFDCKLYLAHRLAWLFVYGYLPENCIDHINRNKSDNSINNLRETSIQCNMRNSKGIYKNNKSGVRGVSWFKKTKEWYAHIKVNNKSIYLGSSRDFTEAVCHRLAAEQCLDWPGCNKYTPAYKYVKNNIRLFG